MVYGLYLKQNQKNVAIISTLIAIIAVLLIVLLFVLIVQPKFNAYVVNKQFEAQQMVVASMINSLNTQGYVIITDANGQSIVLVPSQQPQK